MSEPATLNCEPGGVALGPGPAAGYAGTNPSYGSGLDRVLTSRAGAALLLANLRYWSSVAPEVHRQLARWKARAELIDNCALRTLALEKLAKESFNAELAATLATLVARPRRRTVIEALVALELLFDFLDGLTESPASTASPDGERLSRAFTDAVTPGSEPCEDYYAFHPEGDDGGYLSELMASVRHALARLPAIAAVQAPLLTAAQQSSESQLQIHAASWSGQAGLERWARAQALKSPRQWRELLAGAASSVLCAHALIAAAADPHTTPEQGQQILRAYTWISALPTILDSLVDREQDARAGRSGYLAFYDSSDELAARLSEVARIAIAHARRAPNPGHLVMTLVGIVAYYTSAPTATGDFARRATTPLKRELRPLIGPTLAVMRTWRLARRLPQRRGHAPTASRGRPV